LREDKGILKNRWVQKEGKKKWGQVLGPSCKECIKRSMLGKIKRGWGKERGTVYREKNGC